MLNAIQKYMSAAKAAADLVLSMGASKSLLTCGELNAMPTAGGPCPVVTPSSDVCPPAPKDHAQPKRGKMCILHRGHELDLLLVQNLDPDAIQLMSHPWVLSDIEPHIGVLFIDARCMPLEKTPQETVEGLQKKHQIFMYNSQVLPEDSPLLRMPDLFLVPHMINVQFISGYGVAQRLLQKRNAVD